MLVPTITRDAMFSLSKRSRDVHLSLTISAGVSSVDRFRSIGIHYDPSITASLSMDVVDTVFLKGIGEGVMEGWSMSRFTPPDDGSDLVVSIVDFRLSVPMEELAEDELHELSQQARALAGNCTKQLLDDLEV